MARRTGYAYSAGQWGSDVTLLANSAIVSQRYQAVYDYRAHELRNGGFEAGLDGWTVSGDATQAGVEAPVDWVSGAYAGDRAFAFALGAGQHLALSQDAIVPNGVCDLSVRVRGDVQTDDATHLSLTAVAGGQERVAEVRTITPPSGRMFWREFSIRDVVVIDNTLTVRFDGTTTATYTGRLDHVVLQPDVARTPYESLLALTEALLSASRSSRYGRSSRSSRRPRPRASGATTRAVTGRSWRLRTRWPRRPGSSWRSPRRTSCCAGWTSTAAEAAHRPGASRVRTGAPLRPQAAPPARSASCRPVVRASWSALTLATASSSVTSTYEATRAAAKSGRHCSWATTTHGHVCSARPRARASAARAAKIASAATRNSSSVGRPSVRARSRSSKRSTTSRGRSLIAAGGSCGSVQRIVFRFSGSAAARALRA